MGKGHLSRLNAPKNWHIKRKGTKWITRPNPGPHPIYRGISLNLIIKDILGYGKVTREVKKILNNKEILIDKKVRTDRRFPVGLMDTIEIPKTNEYFRLLLNKKSKFVLLPIKKEESNTKPCRIINKTLLKNKRIQLNLYDGKNIIVNKDNYKVGDTILLDLEKNTIKGSIKLEKGSLIYLTAGKHIGFVGTIKEVHSSNSLYPDKIVFESKDHKYETLKKYAFVINKEISMFKDE